MGVSGSGKSTVAKALGERLGWRFEDGDSFHPPSNVEKMRAGHPLTDEDRWPWLNAIADEIARVCERGEHVIIACSALKHTYRDVLLRGRLPDPAWFLTTAAVSVALLAVAWVVFHRAEYEFAENV